jgi:hypothetical protein
MYRVQAVAESISGGFFVFAVPRWRDYSPLASRFYSAIVKICAGTAGLPDEPPQHPAHGALHRVGAGPVKNFWR